MGLAETRAKALGKSQAAVCLARGDVEECFRLVLEHGISPYSQSAIQMRAMLFMRKSNFEEAQKLTDTCWVMGKDPISAKMRGDILFLQQKFAESEVAYREALALTPDSPDVLHDLGVAIVSQGRTRECLSYFDRAIQLMPERAEFHHHYAIMLLLDGQTEAGWDRMQSRLAVPGVTGSFPYPDKYWKGEDLKDKVIVIRSEQGWGDTIMFARYFPWFTQRAKKVYFYGQRAILSLIHAHYPDVVCWPNDAPVPMDFDYHVNLMCFPRLCGLDVPAPQPKKEKGKGIGVCWFGSPTHKADKLRSVPIERFAPLAEAIDDSLLSLGWGFFWKLENNVAVGDNKPDFVEYCLNERQDWLETAEFVKNLELVITVDTAIAHLAGFLGVECWLLLPYVPDFRWGMSGETTPWYPSMRLYRQPKLMDWDSVFERVQSDLEKRFAPSLEAQAA